MNQFDYKKNSLDYIRLYASIQVLIGHYYVYYRKNPGQIPFLFNGFLGLVILFTISGFLACASMENGGGALKYLKKRFIRILPPYYVCVIINAIVILLIYPILPSIKDVCIWLCTTLLAFHVTPDFLNHYATGSSNGSLWSIFIILQFYIIVSVVYPQVKRWKQWVHLILIAIMITINMLCGYLCNSLLSDALAELLRRTCIPYLYIFWIGMYIYIFRNSIIPLLVKYWYIPVGVYIIGRFTAFSTLFPIWVYCSPFEGIILPILTFTLGYKLGNHRIKYDLSYGIFLYHFAVMNVLIYFSIPIDSTISLLLIIVISIILAVFSLLFVEKPIAEMSKRRI